MGPALEPTAVGGRTPSPHFRLPVAAEAAEVGVWMAVAVLAMLACPRVLTELGPLAMKMSLTLELEEAQAQLSLRTFFPCCWSWEASAKLAWLAWGPLLAFLLGLAPPAPSYGCAAVTTAFAAC